MNDLFCERLVEVTSERDIDSLESRAVVFWKNKNPRVFDRREENKLVFYHQDILDKDVVVERKIPRKYLCNIGNMIAYAASGADEIRDLTPKDGEYYTERRDDLIALGLMRE
ncbi:hypothetical protein KY345_06490 [Candidatus Woesearchaeota archaeon]|nr:hypothetical protein [Candidatus Woesearchaeota archaeon]